MKNLFKIAILLFFTILVGCASSGKLVPKETADQFRVGEITFTDVVRQLGEPNTTINNSKGETVIQYIHAGVGVNAETFIPFVGLFASKTYITTTTLSMTFDENNILIDKTTSKSNMCTRALGRQSC